MSQALPTSSPDEVTLDGEAPLAIHPQPNVVPTTDRPRPIVELVDSDPGSSRDSRSLIQTRLRFASLALGFGFFIFLVWVLIHQFVGQFGHRRWEVFVIHAATTVCLTGIGVWLGKQPSASMACLRWCELFIFGLPALLFTAVQYQETIFLARNFDVIPSMPIAGWIILILAYAIFVPNSWRRVLWVVGGIGLLPLLACAAAAIRHEPVRQSINFDYGSTVELFLGLTATIFIAVSSVRMIEQLRSQASEAKQLGRYRLKEKLGAGGMGEVYLAEHTLLKRPCAIKIIRPEKNSDPRALARFEREVQAASQLNHWNSIYIYDYGRTSDGTFYYVMEYLSGLSLHQLVKKRGPLSPGRVVYLLRQVCEALTEAHCRQLLHRDVKPANIMVTELGGAYDVAKLLDFGLVKPLAEGVVGDEELTQVGTLTGSPLYMSPEQAIGEVELDARSDIYSLGAVAYFALSGRPPFEGSTPFKIMMAHVKETPTSVSSAKSLYFEENSNGSREPISVELESIVMKCLAKKPDERFATARDLSDALKRLPESQRWDERLAQNWWESNCVHYQSEHG